MLAAHRWGSDAPGKPWLGFGTDGRLFGTDGCNRVMGDWAVAGPSDPAEITFGPLISTMLFCRDVDTWLLGAASARCLDDRLEILDSGGVVIGELVRSDCSSGQSFSTA